MFLKVYNTMLVGVCSVLFVMGTVSFSLAEEKICPDPGCNDPVSKAVQQAAKSELSEFGKKAENIKADYSTLDDCLGDLMSVQGIGSFNPINFDNLINELCAVAREQIQDKMQNMELEYGLNLGNSINVRDISGDIFAELEKILRGVK